MAASKRVPREREEKTEGPRGFKFEICIKSTLTFLIVRFVSNIRVYIYIYSFCFDILIFLLLFLFYVQKLVTGITVRENDQIYEILG